jgi:hypothetical protein|nr:DUF4366 domain-containing protein [uncultured Acetatifactor sp.]
MRSKGWMKFLALVVSIGAFSFPMTAFAAGDKDTTPPELTAVLEDETVKIESRDDNSGVEAVFIDGNRVNSLTDGKASVALKDYVGANKNVSVYAVDYAGNRSESVKFANPYYQEPETKGQEGNSGNAGQQDQKPAQQAPQTPAGTQAGSSSSNAGASNQGSTQAGGNNTGANSGNAGAGANSGTGGGNAAGGGSGNSQESASSIPEGAFTPDGIGTVLDEATGEDGDKQFYTITTEDGNVFYLIVDGKRDSQNVYFLNAVTESDLMALAEKDSENSASSIPSAEVCTCTEKCVAGEVDTACPVCRNDLKGCTGKEAGPSEAEEPAEPDKPEKGGSVGTVLFIVIALLAVCGAGYYVKIVRPKQQMEDEEFEDDGYGEGFDPDEAFGETEYLSEDDFDDRIEDDGQEDGE